MTKYLLSVHLSEGDAVATPEVMQLMFAAVDAFNAELVVLGALVFAGGLQPPEQASVVSSDGTHSSTVEGPFGNSKVRLGGFWVIEASDLDAARAWATKGSAACRGPVEVRAFQEDV